MKRIDILLDDVLLEVFDFCVDTTSLSNRRGKTDIEAWKPLIHLCCTPTTPIKDTLDVWPALPLIVMGTSPSDTENVIAALEKSNRVRGVVLRGLSYWKLGQVMAAMEVPFPELTEMRLSSRGNTMPVIPDSFLGGSAPHLLHIDVDGIPFPGLPRLLLSATHLVHLKLHNITYSGYISPEAMVASLSELSSLRTLSFHFRYPLIPHDWVSPRIPPKRSILPALEYFEFEGLTTEYLEDLFTLIDTPQLGSLKIELRSHTYFGIQRLAQFINRTAKLSERNEAHVEFDDRSSGVRFETLHLYFQGTDADRRLSSIVQVCDSYLHPVSTVEDLYIKRRALLQDWENRLDAIENTLWLQLLCPFTAVKNLYLHKEFVPGIAAALQELVGGRIAEVLPGLGNVFVEKLELFEESSSQFVVARRLSGHPVTVSNWSDMSDRDSDTESM